MTVVATGTGTVGAGRIADTLLPGYDVDELAVEPFEPEKPLSERAGAGARATARAFGAGIASVVTGEDGPNIRV